MVICRTAGTLLFAAIGACLACGTGDGGTQTRATPAIALGVNPASASLQQGATGTVIVTLTRTNFTGAVTLLAEGLPAGVTASFGVSPTTGSTSTLTLTAVANAVVGTTTITVRGTSTLAERTSKFSLTITAAPSSGTFSLSSSPDPVSLVYGGDPATATIVISRDGGFNGAVSLVVIPAPPAGLSATLDQATTSGSTVTLTVRATASVVPQQYSLTIIGTTPALPGHATATVRVVVSAPTGGRTATLDFSNCDGPTWVASQDGNGAWTQVVGVNGVYRFNVTSEKGGYATAWQGYYSGQFLGVHYLTQAELTAGTLVNCTYDAGTKNISGTLAGVSLPADRVNISMGGSSGQIGSANGTVNFTLYSVPMGNQDLIAYRTSATGPSASDRAVILRDQDIPHGGSAGTVDFGGSTAFAPESAALTVLGAGGSMTSQAMSYLTGSGCRGGLLNSTAPGSATTLTMYGIPIAQQRATDFHSLWITAVDGSSSTRSVGESFHTMANRTVTLGAPLPMPAVTSLAAPYERLQATVTIPSDYQSWATFSYTTDFTAQITATLGWLGGASATLALPDFTGVSGWRNEWAPATSTTVGWSFTALGSNLVGGSYCSEGATVRQAWVNGKT